MSGRTSGRRRLHDGTNKASVKRIGREFAGLCGILVNGHTLGANEAECVGGDREGSTKDAKRATHAILMFTRKRYRIIRGDLERSDEKRGEHSRADERGGEEERRRTFFCSLPSAVLRDSRTVRVIPESLEIRPPVMKFIASMWCEPSAPVV